LPDAHRRLEVCEKILLRNYGEDFSRVKALKGSDCGERAIIMRLHVLQGVIHFHQNERDAAYLKFLQASEELRGLKVDETLLTTLMEMGYERPESLVALRCTKNNLEAAVNYIHEEREKIKENHRKSIKEREIGRNLKMKKDKDWINPRSVVALMEMGYERDIVCEALRRTQNNVTAAVC